MDPRFIASSACLDCSEEELIKRANLGAGIRVVLELLNLSTISSKIYNCLQLHWGASVSFDCCCHEQFRNLVAARHHPEAFNFPLGRRVSMAPANVNLPSLPNRLSCNTVNSSPRTNRGPDSGSS